MQALKLWRERTNTTQEALAKRVDVTQATIANLENGVHSASAKLLKRLSSETGLSIDELLVDVAGGSNHAA